MRCRRTARGGIYDRVTPYSVGEAYAVGAITGWAARILSPVLLLARGRGRCLHLLSGATGY